MLKKENKTLVIYFSESELENLDAFVKYEDRSRTGFIRHAVKQYILDKYQTDISQGFSHV